MGRFEPPSEEGMFFMVKNGTAYVNVGILKGNFTVANFLFVKERLPSILPDGLWKVIHMIRNKKSGNIVGGFKMLAVLY